MSAVEEVKMDVEEDQGEVETSSSVKRVSLSTQDIAGNILYITKGVQLSQPRLLQRAIKQNATIRRLVQSKQLVELLDKFFPADHVNLEKFKEFVGLLPEGSSEIIAQEEKEREKETDKEQDKEKEKEKTSEEAMDIAETPSTPSPPSLSVIPAPAVVFSVLPEVEVYLCTLCVTTLLRYERVQAAAEAATLLVERIRSFNRRSLDGFSSKAFFYFSLAHEKTHALAQIRPALLSLYRTACVRHDDLSQAVLLNLLLRNYLHYNLVDQAYTLSMRSQFPENASNNQFCRFLYYMGRIQAIQLDYSDAYQRLLTAARKAPQGYATGFTRMVHKLVVLVQLLMGEIPERSTFNQPELRQALKPYFALTQAVRQGDLKQFHEAVELYGEAFKADKNEKLVERLGHNVLKIGLRKISLSYSRVSLQDVAEKLHLPSAEAAEYICSKAILDGVIEAKIDHENGWLSSHEVLDLYSTEEPQRAFHKRIAFCLDVHNEAVKSMRYPPDHMYKKDAKKSDADNLEEKSIEELIKEMEDDYDE